MLLSVFMCVLASPHKTRASSGEGRGYFQHHCFSPGNKVIRKVTKLTMRFKWCSHFQACCNGIRSEVVSRYGSYLLFGRVGLIGKIIFNVCFTNFFSNLFCIRSRADISKKKKDKISGSDWTIETKWVNSLREFISTLNSAIDGEWACVCVCAHLPIKTVRNAVVSHTELLMFTGTVFGLSARHYINRSISKRQSKRQRRICLHNINCFYTLTSENKAILNVILHSSQYQ